MLQNKIVETYLECIFDYLNKLSEKKTEAFPFSLFLFFLLAGFEFLSNLFMLLYLQTKNIQGVFNDCQQSTFLYGEFIEQFILEYTAKANAKPSESLKEDCKEDFLAATKTTTNTMDSWCLFLKEPFLYILQQKVSKEPFPTPVPCPIPTERNEETQNKEFPCFSNYLVLFKSVFSLFVTNIHMEIERNEKENGCTSFLVYQNGIEKIKNIFCALAIRLEEDSSPVSLDTVTKWKQLLSFLNVSVVEIETNPDPLSTLEKNIYILLSSKINLNVFFEKQKQKYLSTKRIVFSFF